ncbi:MAG: hypothetical protein ABI276_00065, partial [Acidimicrobiales bacterium]
VVVVVLVGVAKLGRSHHDERTVTTDVSTTSSTSTSTTLFAQSPTSRAPAATTPGGPPPSNRIATDQSTSTITIATPAPGVDITSFSPQCGSTITVTAQINDARSLTSTELATADAAVPLVKQSDGTWAVSVPVSRTTAFTLTVVDDAGGRTAVNGLLQYC